MSSLSIYCQYLTKTKASSIRPNLAFHVSPHMLIKILFILSDELDLTERGGYKFCCSGKCCDKYRIEESKGIQGINM